MYCRYCGKEIQEDSIYCSYCGKKLVTEKTVEILPTKVTNEDLKNAWSDDFGVKYSSSKKRLLKAPCDLETYNIPQGTVCIANEAFAVDEYSFTSLKSINIPDSVTSIGKGAFYNCDLQQITIPDSVTSIGDEAFYNCVCLQQITIPDSVTSIGDEAFYNCRSLQRIIVDNNNPKYDSRNDCNAIVETSSNKLIAGCVNTIIPDSVTSIEDSAFYGCWRLQKITIPDSITSIGDSAFYGCDFLQQITIPDSVTSIGKEAFCECKSLQQIIIPNSVKSIGDEAFCECESLQQITISDSITSIGEYAFYCCKSLQQITIPNSVTSIGDDAFYGCRRLQKITIPDSVTSIGEYAFDGTSLQQITIPDSVTSIGEGAFWECESLQSIYVSPEKISFFKNLLPDYVKLIKAKPTSNTSVKSNQTGKASSPYYLFFDTETTGLPLDYNAPTSNSANWPRLVQLSWIVTDVDGNIIKQSDNIIYPDGFIIPTESSNIHGITTAIAKEKGIPLATAINEFLADMNTVNILVGHNISFDLHIMGAELVRMGKRDIMQQKPSICTMQSSVNYCKIPSKNGFGYKWPRLQELHVKLFGYEFEDAHNSMSDITATLNCFKELKRRGIINK